MALSDADATLIVGLPAALVTLLGMRVRVAKKGAIEKLLADAIEKARERDANEIAYLRQQLADLIRDRPKSDGTPHDS